MNNQILVVGGKRYKMVELEDGSVEPVEIEVPVSPPK